MQNVGDACTLDDGTEGVVKLIEVVVIACGECGALYESEKIGARCEQMPNGLRCPGKIIETSQPRLVCAPREA